MRDSGSKMSKSNKSDFSRINLMDAPEVIRNKITRAKTDSIMEIRYDEERKELANLLRIFAEVRGGSPQEILEEFRWDNIMEFKKDLSEVLVEEIRPIREKTLEILASGEIEDRLKEGLEKARGIASKNMEQVRKMIGFL